MNQLPDPLIDTTNTPIKPEAGLLHLPHASGPALACQTQQTSRAPVLAVDDDHAVLLSIKRVLRRSKLDVETAASGDAALKLLGPWLPEIVLLDVSMPGMSGQAFLRRFRQKEAAIRANGLHQVAPIPVMFVSAVSGHRQRIDGLNAGAVDYLTKPYDPEELRARVCSQLRHHRSTRQFICKAQSNHPHPSSGAAA